jgi:16S rRNA (guanine966-N2)-methyltransferase
MFDVLSSMDCLEDASVLDLFAGSGALGIECLSRGARSAVLVERDARAVETIRHNLSVLDPMVAGAATVVRADAVSYLASAGRFDLVLADPPYDFDAWPAVLERLATRAGLLVAETGTGRGSVPWSPGSRWETVKEKRYGSTLVSIVHPESHS